MKNMKKTLLSALIGAAVIGPAAALAEVTANVGVTSNYIWRGFEQTEGDPAISAGLDYAADSGFYAGTWVSNASWADDVDVELDLYGGYGGSINEAWSYDVGFIYYAYPGADDADFSEIYGSVSNGGLTLGAAILSSGSGADFGDTLYLSADYGFEVSEGVEVGLHAGSYTGDWLSDDFFDIGATVGYNGFTLGLSKLNEGDDDVKVYVSYGYEFGL